MIQKNKKIQIEELNIQKEKNNYFFQGNRIEECATKAKINVEGLMKTIKNYNISIDRNRKDKLGRPRNYMYKIDTPFFILQNWLAPLHNSGGLLTNNKLQVLNVFGKIIHGLYGAGEVAGGDSGEVYLTGTYFPRALTHGFLLGNKFVIQDLNN